MKKIILYIVGVFCIMAGILGYILVYEELNTFNDIICAIISCISLIGCGAAFVCLGNISKNRIITL